MYWNHNVKLFLLKYVELNSNIRCIEIHPAGPYNAPAPGWIVTLDVLKSLFLKSFGCVT